MKIVVICSYTGDQLVRDQFGDDVNIVKIENGATALQNQHVRNTRHALEAIERRVAVAPDGTTLDFALVSDIYGDDANVDEILRMLRVVEKRLARKYHRSRFSYWALRHSIAEFKRIGEEHGQKDQSWSDMSRNRGSLHTTGPVGAR